MKLDTQIEGHEGNARTITLSPVFTKLLPFLNFCSEKLVRSISESIEGN